MLWYAIGKRGLQNIHITSMQLFILVLSPRVTKHIKVETLSQMNFSSYAMMLLMLGYCGNILRLVGGLFIITVSAMLKLDGTPVAKSIILIYFP